MPITTPSELRQFLISLGISARKAFSQNFLIDQNIVQKILSEADLKDGDSILEIGPGPGALTEQILKKNVSLTAVEYDRALAKALERFDILPGHLTIAQQDFLKFPLENLTTPTKVIANLPYHISTVILERLLLAKNLFSDFVLMFQQEYINRISAPPSCKDFGALTIFINFYCDIVQTFPVSRNCFYPSPNVDSAVIHLRPKRVLPEVDEAAFFTFVRNLFSQRRKTLLSRLKKINSQAEEKLTSLSICKNARPENLGLEQWIALFKSLH
jgi:16S rRNA (adenine1518-N6/adenine1519-N6)-dimethyltransferase